MTLQTELEQLGAKSLLFDAIADNAPLNIYLKALDGTFIWVNQRFARTYGKTVEDFIGKLTTSHLDSKVAKISNDHGREVISSGTSISKEVVVGDRIYNVLKCPVYDSDGKITAIVGYDTDITEQKAAQQRSQRLVEVIDLLDESAILFDADDRLVFANEAWKELNSQFADDVHPGTSFEDHIRLGVEKGMFPEAIGREEEWLRGRMAKHRNQKGPVVVARQGGQWIRVHEQVLPDNGVILIISDITELKQSEKAVQESEAKLREILENSPIGVAIVTNSQDRNWDASKRLFVNKELVRMFGAGSAEELLDADITSSWVDQERLNAGGDITKNGGYLADFEALRRRMDGTEWWVSMNSRPIIFDGKNCTMNWHFDITDKKRAEEVLKTEHDDLELRVRDRTQELNTEIAERKEMEVALRRSQKMEAVGYLAGGVAHDFNNLLAVMIGNAEMLESRVGDDKQARQNIEALYKAVGRGSSLTNRLLAFSRQQTLSPQATAINRLIFGLKEMLQRTLGETIELSTRLEPEISDALIDPHQLEDALVNLSINAQHAMPNGGSLVIETSNVTLDENYAAHHEEVIVGDYVKVSVSDTGGGMSAEVREQVFEPFFTTKDVGKGSGLGLSMVYGFIKQSKGHVAITSKLGHGTTIELYLPRSRAAVVEEASTDEITEFSLGPLRVLLVEDDANVREISTRIFRDQGFMVVEAENGNDAIKQLKELPPFDLLFTDVVLPGGMNGAEIAEQARQMQPNIKVLFTTGYGEAVIGSNGEVDFDMTVVNKPYRRAELLETVQAIFSSAEV